MSRSNVPSTLLSDVENVVVFKLLADRVQSLSTAVVQLVTSSHLVTSSRGKATWNLVVTGVACFVKDWNRRGFFIQVNIHHMLSILTSFWVLFTPKSCLKYFFWLFPDFFVFKLF